jgi:hypothetical protein
MSTERDPEASHASCAEVVSPRPDGASPPESIEVVACALLQTPHLRHFRATAERGALWKARVEQNFSVFFSSKVFGLQLLKKFSHA